MVEININNEKHEDLAPESVNERDRELWAQPSIQSQMPIEFENGVHWDVVQGFCAQCGESIELRGYLTCPTTNVAVIDAIGRCDPCRLFTRFYYRFHDDMRISGLSSDGQWFVVEPKKGIWDRVGALLSRLFHVR